jgi:transposase
MSKRKKRMQQNGRCFVGLDWGESSHSVSVVDEKRSLLEQFEVGGGLDDLHQLAQHLKCREPIAGIAIEATCHPVVGYLLSQGYTVYPVNPKMSKAWRLGTSVAGVKSDRRDGLVLALELARRHESLRPLKPGEPAAAELAGLCEKQRQLIDTRTVLLQRLKATLRQYYRGALDFFSDWSSPTAWRFLKRFPNPAALAGARKQTLISFLKANHIGLHPYWLERIERRVDAEKWPVPPDSMGLQILALATIAQLQGIQPHIDQCDHLIAERIKTEPKAQLLRSLPGAGKRLVPGLLVITATVEEEDNSLQAMRCLSGIAPVEDQSGKRRNTKIRRRCNKHWRNTMFLFARCSTCCCAWARAFYDLHRQNGDTHACALRKLADKWIKIIIRMLATGQPYDDQRYVQSLRQNRSPVYQKLGEQTGG